MDQRRHRHEPAPPPPEAFLRNDARVQALVLPSHVWPRNSTTCTSSTHNCNRGCQFPGWLVVAGMLQSRGQCGVCRRVALRALVCVVVTTCCCGGGSLGNAAVLPHPWQLGCPPRHPASCAAAIVSASAAPCRTCSQRDPACIRWPACPQQRTLSSTIG